MEEVKLHGFWASPYVYRVIWALKLKGINYHYIEEDLSHKSPLLLQHNPIHKKVPVLVHAAKPISESLLILQYIDETWPENPLLPGDAYARAIARFWMKFGEERGLTFFAFFKAVEREKDEAAKAVVEALKILEEEALGDNKFFGGETLGMVDLAFGWLAHWFAGSEEVVGRKVLEPNTLPRLHQWTKNFKEHPVIKENLPDYHKLLAHLKRIRDRFVSNVSI